MSLGGTTLLVVDPQMDFHEGGSLAVPGASADAVRIARLIVDHSDDFEELVVTLDSHHVRALSYFLSLFPVFSLGLPFFFFPFPLFCPFLSFSFLFPLSFGFISFSRG